MASRYQILTTGGVFDHQDRAIVKPGEPTWPAYQEWLTAGNMPLPPDAVGQDDLATAKAKRCAEIDAYAAGLRNLAIRGRSAGEMASWSIKLAEARAHQANPTDTSAPTLAAIATVRGISTAAMVAKVVAQATPFLQAEAAIDGVRGKHCDAVASMTDVRDIVTYDWHSGWPVIPGG